jgi:hypothetical protein
MDSSQSPYTLQEVSHEGGERQPLQEGLRVLHLHLHPSHAMSGRYCGSLLEDERLLARQKGAQERGVAQLMVKEKAYAEKAMLQHPLGRERRQRPRICAAVAAKRRRPSQRCWNEKQQQ